MAQRRFPKGTKLFVGDNLVANTPSYVEVEGIISVGLPFGFTVDEEDVTTHGDVAGTNPTKIFQATLGDRGEVPFELFFDWADATHRNIITLSYARTKRAIKVQLPIQTTGNTTPESYAWDGFIKSMTPPSAALDTHIRMSGSIRVASDFTRVAEAA